MPLEATTSYNKEIISKAALLYWRKTFASTLLLSLACVAFSATLVFYLDLKDWISGTFLALSILSSVIFIWAFFIYRNRSMAIFNELEPPVTHWTFTDEGVSVESSAGKSELKWNLFKGLIKSDRIWLLVYKNGAYSVFPLGEVSDEVLVFLSGKLRTKGRKRK